MSEETSVRKQVNRLASVISAVIVTLSSLSLTQAQITTLINETRRSVVTVVAYDGDGKPTSQGTGFFLNGLLVTNHHVLSRGIKAVVKSNNRTFEILNTVAEDADSDLIAVRVNLRESIFPSLRLSSTPVISGQRVLVIGSPLGLEQTVSEGIVSAVREIEGIGRVIQITAPISPGSSGSPVINFRGEVVGIASMHVIGGQNLNFAIPSARIYGFLNRHAQSAGNRSRSRRPERANATSVGNKKEIDQAAFDKMLAEMMENERKSIPILEERISKNPRDVAAYEELGRAYSNNQQQSKAIALYERALLIAPQNVTIRAALCDDYSSMDEYEQALVHCNEALRLRPSYSYVLTSKGTALAGLGRIDEAIDTLKKAIEEDAEASHAHEQLGFIYMNLGRYQHAIKAFEFMASIASRYAPSFVDLAWAYETVGRNDEAEVNYKKAIQIDQKYDDAYVRLAQLYEREDRESDAIAEYRQAVAANPQNADAYLFLGLLYLSTGDRRSTLNIYQQLKKIDPAKARQLASAIYK